MRKAILPAVLLMGLILSACYTYTINYGDGPQRYVETTENQNHYFLWGLVRVGEKPAPKPQSGATNYQLIIEHTFIDGLIGALTMGIYTPTTTTIVE